jgi:PAS domain S-box-containing protein
VIIAPRPGRRGHFHAVVARDITEQKKTEAALRAQAARLTEQARLLDLAQIVVRDPENRIILWNTGAEKLYGWTKSEAIGRVSHSLFRTVFPEPLEAINARLLDTGHWEGELTNTTKDGRRPVVASHWVLQRDERGTPSAVLEVSNDITEPKRLEQELVESQAQLRALSARLQSVLEEERARVARDIHDDLGQALTALKLDVSWLNGRFAGPRGVPKRALAEKTRAMLDLIDTTAGKVRNICAELGVLDSSVSRPPSNGAKTEACSGPLPPHVRWCGRAGSPGRLAALFRSSRASPTSPATHGRPAVTSGGRRRAGGGGARRRARHHAVRAARHAPLGLLGMRDAFALLAGG